MAKSKKPIDSFNGFTFGATDDEIEPSAQQFDPQEPSKSIVSEKNKPMEPDNTFIAKRGRPKVNREKKKRVTFTILPSIYEQAKQIAYNEGKSVSELIEIYFSEYVKNHKGQQ